MLLFYAGAGKGMFQDILYNQGVRNILLSFYWDKNENLKEIKEKGFNIFLDSGGYSARKFGANINIQNYGEFLKQNKDYIFTAANLDVMNLDEALKNQKYLEQFYPILPVYHYSEYAENKRDLLEQFCKNYDYIAIGGMAGMELGNQMIKNFLNYCFKITTKYKKKVHGFGITSLDRLKDYPFYTVDSTSWLVGGKFGTILKYKEGIKMETNLHYSEKDKMIRGNIPVKLIDSYQERLKNNVIEILKMEKWVTKLWKIRGINWD